VVDYVVRREPGGSGDGATHQVNLAARVGLPLGQTTTRFEVCNDSVVGRQIEFSDPMLIEAP